MQIVPLTLSRANALVAQWHRHHKPAVGHRFSLGAALADGRICGAAIVGRPISREVDQYNVAEVVRLVTDGTDNACSFLYGASARVAREMGFSRIQTYILITEPGTSLKAAGWNRVAIVAAGSWSSSVRTGLRRTDQPEIQKVRWERQFKRNTYNGNSFLDGLFK